jgi:hypothetical protein
MNTPQTDWLACTGPDGTVIRCAVCHNEIDLQVAVADHHPRVCPACGVDCAFLPWKKQTIQVVMGRAPGPLAGVIRWAQKHLDELEFVELVCAIEEIAQTIARACGAAPQDPQHNAGPGTAVR